MTNNWNGLIANFAVYGVVYRCKKHAHTLGEIKGKMSQSITMQNSVKIHFYRHVLQLCKSCTSVTTSNGFVCFPFDTSV